MIWLTFYAAILFILSAIRPGKATSTREFYVCGNSSSTMSVAISIMASCIGGSATIGMIGLAWQVGWPAFWWLGSGAIGLVILAIFLARKTRESGALTMPEIMGNLMGRQAHIFASLIILAAWLAILAAQLSALGLIVASLTGLTQYAALSGGAIFLLAYTAIGGQPAVVKSDIYQFAVLLAALVLAFCFALAKPAGLNALLTAPVEVANSDFTFSRLRYFLCILGGSYVVCPMLFGRLLCAKNAATARSGAFAAALGIALAGCLITALGIACRGSLPSDISPENALLAFSQGQLPEWAQMAVMLGLFSAIISSADSCLMTAASICANDVAGKGTIGWCRGGMFMLTLAGCSLAMCGKGILALLLMANDIYVCGIVCPVFVGMLANGKASRKFLFAAMVAGGGIGLLSAALDMEQLAVTGVAVSLLISVAAVIWKERPGLAASCQKSSY